MKLLNRKVRLKMSKFKYSELEKMIQEVKESDMDDRIFLYSEMIKDISRDDEYSTNLARKVCAKEINSLLRKIQELFQREDANCKSTEGRTEIDILIDWLKHIDND